MGTPRFGLSSPRERDFKRLAHAAAEALERVQVGDCIGAELALETVIRLDGTLIPRP